jgi:hypothetical protein
MFPCASSWEQFGSRKNLDIIRSPAPPPPHCPHPNSIIPLDSTLRCKILCEDWKQHIDTLGSISFYIGSNFIMIFYYSLSLYSLCCPLHASSPLFSFSEDHFRQIVCQLKCSFARKCVGNTVPCCWDGWQAENLFLSSLKARQNLRLNCESTNM